MNLRSRPDSGETRPATCPSRVRIRARLERTLSVDGLDGPRPDHTNAIYVGNALAGVLLELGRPEEAREHLERVLQLRAVAEVDPTLVAESKFRLAKALTASSGSSADDRRRARELARAARDAYAARAHHWKDQLAEIETWLVAHPR